MLELSRARASTCQTRALCKIDVHLISTLVNKSLYYYYYYSRQHDVSLMRVSILHLRFEKEICRLEQILDSFPFSIWQNSTFVWNWGWKFVMTTGKFDIFLDVWFSFFLYMTKFPFNWKIKGKFVLKTGQLDHILDVYFSFFLFVTEFPFDWMPLYEGHC